MESDGSQNAAKYLAYPAALARLRERLNATPEELAAWIYMGYMGSRTGGIAAYESANELDPPPQFRFRTAEWSGPEDHDYIAPMMACWFRADEIETFQPTERFVVGRDLLVKWSKVPGINAASYVIAKIRESKLVDAHWESRLEDTHPIYGGTLGTFPEEGYPPIELGLFRVSDIEAIESEDGIAAYVNSNELDPAHAPGSNSRRAVPVARQHQDMVLSELRKQGFDPESLPPYRSGKASPAKQAVKKALVPSAMDTGAFRKAWQNLLAESKLQQG
jgi:hypothetical protein